MKTDEQLIEEAIQQSRKERIEMEKERKERELMELEDKKTTTPYEFERQLRERYTNVMGHNAMDTSINYFTREQQIERYSNFLAFYLNEENKLLETDQYFCHKKMILSSKRMVVQSRMEELFDRNMITEIYQKANEIVLT
jgi:hypothetical protein